MTRRIVIFISIFLLLFLLRLQAVGGFHGIYSDIEMENLGITLRSQRQYLSRQISNYLPQNQASLLSGILLGERSDLPTDLRKALIDTSTIHIVVVSGQNLSLLAGLLMNLAYLFGRKKTVIFTMLVICFYSLLTGLQIPVLRAAIMSLVSLFGILIGRERQSWWILILTAGAMLLFEPNWLLSLSFQLSFLATFASVVMAKPIAGTVKKIPPFIREDFAVTITAQLLTLPIIAANFHRISLIGILSNILILWTIVPIMITGSFALIFSFFLPSLGTIPYLIPDILLTCFLYIVTFFSQIPMASVETPPLHPVFWLGYYFLVFGVFLLLLKKNQYTKQNMI